MWILIRVILAITGFAIRQLARRKLPEPSARIDDIPVYERVWRVSQKRWFRRESRIAGFEVGMPRTSPTWIRLHAESAADRAFKRLGIANEVQTGDVAFDDQVYVVCDHPYVHALLAESPELRDAIRAALGAGYRRVRFDGTMVWLERASDIGPTYKDHQVLRRIHAASRRLQDAPPSRLGDRFLWRALVVESVIWSLAGYAVGGLIELVWSRADLHLDQRALVVRGLLFAGAVLVVLLGVIVLWLRGSSRGHRVILESAIVLVLALPFAGIQLVSDTNRALDSGAPSVSRRIASHCEVREGRSGRRSRRNTSYHLWLEPIAEGDPRAPTSLRITRALCDAVTPGAEVTLEIKPGQWGLPWIRAIRVNGAELLPEG